MKDKQWRDAPGDQGMSRFGALTALPLSMLVGALFWALVIGGCVALSGCKTTRKAKPRVFAPPNIKEQCVRAWNEAFAIVSAVHPNVKQHVVVVHPRLGEKWYGYAWGWYDPEFGPISELVDTGGRHLHIAVNPHNTAELHYGVLLHGMVHHVLATNGYGLEHHHQFDHVPEWKRARELIAW